MACLKEERREVSHCKRMRNTSFQRLEGGAGVLDGVLRVVLLLLLVVVLLLLSEYT